MMKQKKTKLTMKQTKNLFFVLLLFLGNMIIYAQCSVNAGGNATICGTSYSLQGSFTGTTVGNPTWTLVSKPAGATDPVISNINSYTPNVTGMTSPGNYVFQISQVCASTGITSSQVTITAPGDASTFTAGPDITNVNATVGTVTLNGVVPAGYTASWSAYNIYNYQRFGTKASNNATFGSPASASTSFTLTKKANHNEDPAYLVTLRITSTTNPNCWYEDTAIVRFIPNPQIIVPNTSACAGNGATYIYLSNTSPIFGTDMAGGAGNPSYGTTVTMNVNSQPAGGNIQYAKIMDGILFFTGANVTGAYKFTLTVTNSSGTYTTPEITYTNSGTAPGEPTFIVASDPEQMEYYSTLRTGGEVQCGMAGSTTPITFRFTLASGDPVTNTSTVSTTGIYPPGGAPIPVITGAGTAIRSVTATPPAGGWRVGTYKFPITISNGSCSVTVTYFLHISDGARPPVSVNNTTVCYPGSGVVSATINLPAVYKGVVNSSYFQELNGQYTFTLVSKPAGSGTPTAPTTSFTSTSAVIGNLTMPGEYVFKIKAGNTTTGDFVGKEYECSGTSREGTFSVFVSGQVNSNAGSAQTLTGTTQTTLNGNNPGVASGTWTLVSKPSGADDPVIVTPSVYNSNVTGLNTAGTYSFRWIIATGTCISSSDVNINVIVNNCVSGCNPNTFVNSSDPNTIEYDNMVSAFHATIIKEGNGSFKVWGENSAADGTHLLSPTAVTPANGFNYTGTPLKATAGSSAIGFQQQFALLTTDGLYMWGSTSTLVISDIKSTSTFGKITVNGKTDGLPAGVTPADVKMMFGSYGTLAITTCSGEAWVLSFAGDKNGDGTTDGPANYVIWHRVKTSATTNLVNVVAMRGTYGALFALTSDGKLYTWGTGTYINSGAAANRLYATLVSIPAGVTPKMIGMTRQYQGSNQSYYLLATNGKLYSMGSNGNKQLGDGTTTERTSWVQPQKVTDQNGQGTGPLENIAWISPNEHDGYIFPAINVLTNDRKLWAWGYNSRNMFGGAISDTYYDPIYMPGNSTSANGMKVTDEIIAVETGGHTTINIKKGENRFGYVGHRIDGSMGDSSPAEEDVPTYSYNTSIVMVCGADVGPKVQDIQVCQGTTANLNDANLTTPPSDVEWHATNDVSSPVISNITAVAPGTYYAFFTVASGKPRTVGSAATITTVVCCQASCNPNTYVNSSDPNTIEYDNMVSAYHSTIIKESAGTFKIWGEKTAADGTSNLLTPTAMTPVNGFNYTGTPLKATSASSIISAVNHQYALLTTDGLYVWGTANTLINSSIKSTTAFGKITVNGKADGLPSGVIPAQVKMMFGSYGTLAITTCSGEAYVLSMVGAKNGDGTAEDGANNAIWHRIKTSATTDLVNAVAVRGTANALFALTSDSKLYTWGTGTYINSGTASNRTYATEVSIPAGATPKMIGMTDAMSAQSYYLLATNGKLYSMGDNSGRQLGDGTTTTRTSWVQPQKMTNQSGQGTGVLQNIVWISPNEHSYYSLASPSTAAINVLTNGNKQWAWGVNNGFMFGGPAWNVSYDPIYMPGNSTATNGMKVTDEIIAVETGGHTTINIKKGENKFGYVGHRVSGSMGDGSSVDEDQYVYTYNTAAVMVCGADPASYCYKPGITTGTALDTKVGISALGRAGATDADNWPMTRKGGHIALESKTKGFVPNRVAFDASGNPVGIATTNFIEGMMVYDTSNKCLKIYTSKDNGVSFGWYCITTQACPD